MADREDGVLRSAGHSSAPISFSFSRTAARRRLADRGEGLGAAPEEKDFLKTVEGRKLQSVNPSEAPKELIIPLIQNGLRRQPPAQAPGPSTDKEAVVDGVLSQAVKELIEESKKSLEERENAGVDPTLAIPMIQKGCNPNEEGSDSERQAETVPKEADYEAVPVEAYGLAMLRGMGWKPGQGIGRTFNQVVKPRVNSLRPKGLGLGASLTEVQALAPTGPHRLLRPDEEQEKDKEDQRQGLVPGGAVVVLSGPYRGLYGKVEGLDPDNVRAMVRLAVGSRMVTVSEYCLQPVSQQEFDKNSLDLSQVSKTSPGQQNGTASSSLKAFPNQDLPTRRGTEERKRKHLPDRQDKTTSKSEKVASRRQHWLHRDLRVRFVDKLHKGGQYYNTKMTIEDVLSPDTCVCRTDKGQVLEGVREDMLETLIPKVQGKRVMVVLGPQSGRVGRLLGWDREQSQAVVQLRRENRLVELHYDAVCEYMGPSDSDED
ncbi:G-patch domain and KOW motifs-containing protein [Pteronotus mesoamericanus]|uniref:G-patch domain and KOW motifs-containing protein n=1 Tax=Pteronotus mesoamericanus TaxID=1884717 RepID=UPI0023EC7C19|nr:G-patch domain and KOW motifs-containing protein [Pteronotus parnellii mesoamericanus]XP_054422409.1 G-patch domain and KOW motifs-containing protein [Pteronotus parnellii mesoamericanus]XP_054422410.1 G-patch domain and KOW motifs-containing protein [Pteronotus parnellii mesoamericanus]XP_054422411.1 G-patch domain and KOW motifs-containing protein [Pteronotus parnellii mesoamericanus]XP_054422412.1 G-patch domain and KOW motifs-containing protein [Pteronotus parnellii mesoamericanus]XP_05